MNPRLDNVLVGYDGGDASEDAYALARALAGSTGTVTAACAYWWQPLSARPMKRHPGEMQMRAGAEEALSMLSGRGGPVVLTVPAPGTTPARALLDLAEEREYDLVVVGSTHRGKVGRVLAGTTADALLRDGPCAVAVAPLGYRERASGLRRVGVAFDTSVAARSALSAAHALAADRGAELVVLRVFNSAPAVVVGDAGYAFAPDFPEVRDAAHAGLDEAVTALGGDVPAHGELLEGDPGPALAERSADLDLLVAGSKGHGVLGRVLLGSVSHHLMCESAAPVLVVPPQ